MQATQLCQRCGYDLPVDTGDCPQCRGREQPPSRAARQVAGIDLPTRSVHTLEAVPPLPEPRVRRRRSLRRRNGAIDLLACTGLLALLTAAGWMVTVVAHTDRFTARLAPVTLDRLDDVVIILACATVAAALLTLLATAVRAIRRRRA